MKRDLGTPAATAEELAGAPEGARRAADDELARAHRLTLEPAESPIDPGNAPTVDAATGGEVTPDGGCVDFVPAATRDAGEEPAIELTVPAGGLVVTAPEAGGAAVSVRRFADGFPEEPLAEVAPGGSGLLIIREDLARAPWHVRVAPEARVTACSASS